MFLVLESQLLARLSTALPAWDVRGTLALMPDLAAEGAPDAVCRLSYAGSSVAAQQQTKAKLMQRWEVALYVREAETHADRIAAVDTALDAIVASLTGWTPGPGLLEMRLVEAPFDVEDGIAKFSLVFESQAIVGT